MSNKSVVILDNPARAEESGAAREIAEVQAALVIAKRFPRDPIEATDRVLRLCSRPALAQHALYSFNKGGQSVTGPSIRLAEAIAQAWGNLQFGVRELSQENGESVVEAYAWDVESNTRQTKRFHVRHEMRKKDGSVVALKDARDVYETVANAGARRLRACILGVIPGDVVEAAVEQCEGTLRASADCSPEALKKLAEAFSQMGVTQPMLEKRVGCRLGSVTPAQVVQLRKVYVSIRDGMSAAADWFGPAPSKAATERTERVTEALVGLGAGVSSDPAA